MFMEGSNNMNLLQLRIIFWLILLVGCSSIDLNSNRSLETPAKTEIIISAAASLKEVMSEIKPLYREKNPQVAITYNFAASGTLQRQIEQGAPVDIFMSADRAKIKILQQQGLLESDTIGNFLQNKIVLITERNNNLAINSFADLTTEDIDIVALGEPLSVPAGKYAQEVLNYFQIAEQIEEKAVYGKDVRQVLNYVATNNADVGLVYSTDAKVRSNRVKIIAIAPPQAHSTINYAIAVTGDSNNPQAAREFVKFLNTERVRDIFTNYGFIPVNYNY